ncbi:hypothetical protein LSTR_LSTR004052 [Laodelphax striatellus]|uniref:Lipase domain-containing protein n=1 Tax=Laodelphax striatellus TaxID=195883 RepID=A0A482WF86_LAOST|nr:hypothetical protein LSTR_LSTR004052 [Laodelphax striatellus]
MMGISEIFRVENVNRNFYVKFLKYSERKAAVWRPEEVCSGDKLNEMSLSQRGEIITNMIAKDFCDWLRGLGGVEETSMDEDILKELFQIGLENPAARSICVQMRERPVVSHHLAEAVQIPERAFQKGLLRQIEWDVEAEKKGLKKWAFGRRLPPSQQWYPPRNQTSKMWFDTKTITDNLRTFSLLFKNITDLSIDDATRASSIDNTTTNSTQQTSFDIDRVEEPHANKPPRKVCYNELGCYSSEYPWNETDYLPSSPETINAKFYLSNRMTGANRTLLTTRPNLEIDVSLFDMDKWVVFVTHGFFGSAVLDNWIGEMEEALLIRGDVNVIACDWSPGSRTINYAQAAANARVVGAEIARVAQFLLDYNLAAKERIHLIGQSLGAHAMSYAAVNLKSVAHLTGLDPAQPGFEGAHPDVRIDPTDADFVEVIHTDARPFLPDLGLGLIEPAVVGDYFSCNHRRAHQYYIEALKTDCSFWARKWTPYGPLPELNPCTPEDCQEMGKYTSLFPARGTFYVQTKFPAPYCVWEQESDDNMIEYLLENNINLFLTSAPHPTKQQLNNIAQSNIE